MPVVIEKGPAAMSSDGEGNAQEPGRERIATVDVANFEILAAIRERGCALCSVEGLAEWRLVEGFLREGRYNPATRERFMRSGGFCHRHAWQLHRAAQEDATGAGIADIYGQLIGYDIARLDATRKRLITRRGRRQLRRRFRRQARCQALCGRGRGTPIPRLLSRTAAGRRAGPRGIRRRRWPLLSSPRDRRSPGAACRQARRRNGISRRRCSPATGIAWPPTLGVQPKTRLSLRRRASR